MGNESSRGSRTLLLFGFITLLSGLELCGQRWIDLFALRPAVSMTNPELLKAGTYDRVRFDPAQLRFRDALYYRADTKAFFESDPRVTIRATGPTEVAALAAQRKELHGAHVIVEDVGLASPPFALDRENKLVRGEAFLERMFASLQGTSDTLYVAPPRSDFAARTRFEGTLVALGEADRYSELSDVLRVSGRVDPDQVKPFMILDGEAVPRAVTKLIPLGESYNLFVVAPEGVDLATTPAEGTIDKPIDSPAVRGSLRRMVIQVRQHGQLDQPLRFIYPGTAAAFRASPDAPFVVHPGGGIFLLVGLVCSVFGIAWGARRDRSGTEGKLWFELAIGLVELGAVAVPAAYFLLNRPNQEPAPPIGGAPAAASSFAQAAVPLAVAADKPEDVDAATRAVAAIASATNSTQLGQLASVAESACAKVPAAVVCARDRSLREVTAVVALLGKSKGEKSPLCQRGNRAARRLVDAKVEAEPEVRDALADLGRACL